MVLCIAQAMGEFGATITIVFNSPGETQALPSAIDALTQVPGGDADALRLAPLFDGGLIVRFGRSEPARRR